MEMYTKNVTKTAFKADDDYDRIGYGSQIDFFLLQHTSHQTFRLSFPSK